MNTAPLFLRDFILQVGGAEKPQVRSHPVALAVALLVVIGLSALASAVVFARTFWLTANPPLSNPSVSALPHGYGGLQGSSHAGVT